MSTPPIFIPKQFKSPSGIITNYADSEAGPDDTTSTKPGFVFVHGGRIRPLNYYKSTLDELAKDFRVIVPEIPGFLNSFFPARYLDMREIAQFFNELAAGTGVKEYFTSGHSLGGGVAILMAESNPAVKGVVSASSSGCPLKISEAALAYRIMKKTIREGHTKYGLKALERVLVNTKELFENKNGGAASTNFALKAAHYAMQKDYSPYFRKVSAPTLLIHSKKDNLFPRRGAEYLHDLIPRSELLEVKGYHDWAVHEPEMFTKTITDFINRVRAN